MKRRVPSAPDVGALMKAPDRAETENTMIDHLLLVALISFFPASTYMFLRSTRHEN